MNEERHSKWYKITGLDRQNEPVEIYFYKEIGSGAFDNSKICSEEFCRELDEIPKTRQVIIRMNSRGGSFYDGLAIAHKIHDRGNVQCYIDGACASAASVVAMACEKVVAGEGTSILIHNSSASLEGVTANDLKEFIKSMEDVDLQMANIYARKSRKPLSFIQTLMNRGERLTAEKALELGFVDEIKKISNESEKKYFPLVAEDVKQTNKSHITMEEKQKTEENQKTKITAENWADFFPPMSDVSEAVNIYAKAKEAEMKVEIKEEAYRFKKIINALNNAICDRKIKNTSKGIWLEAALKDDSVLKLLDELPPMNYEPVDGMNLDKFSELARRKQAVSVASGVHCDKASINAYSSYQNKIKNQ